MNGCSRLYCDRNEQVTSPILTTNRPGRSNQGRTARDFRCGNKMLAVPYRFGRGGCTAIPLPNSKASAAGLDEREPGGYAAYRGIWFVGRKKSTLCKAFTRWHIDLMPEAQQRFDALPSSFPLFRHVVWQDDGEGNFTHVGWAGMGSGISNGGAAVEGTSERDLGPEGTQTPENEEMRLRESITRVEAA